MAVYKFGGSSPEDPAMKVQKQSNPLIPGLKLLNKVDNSCAIHAYVPGVAPPPPRMAADKWIRKALYCGTPLNCSYNQ